MIDLRDRVYGVIRIRIAVNVNESSIDVDYSALVVSVYSQVFQHVLSNYKTLSLLAYNPFV